MSIGLPKKQDSFLELVSKPDGAPLPGTDMFYKFEKIKKNSYANGYLDGMTYTLEYFQNILKKLVYLDVDVYGPLEDEFSKLPKKYSRLKTYLHCLTCYMQGYKSQVNNNNKGHYREQTHKLILRAENLLRLPRGTIIDPMLCRNYKPYAGTTDEPEDRTASKTKAKPVKKPKGKKKPVKPDPTDELINNTENLNED